MFALQKEEKNSAENNNKKTKKQAADKKIKHQVNEIISKKEKEKVEAPIQPLPQPSKEMSIEEVKEVKEQLVAPVVQNGISAVPAKDKKKKKSEFNVLTQNHEKSALNVNLSQMITLVRKADMSKQDVQTLIDVLLNKQQMESDVMLTVCEFREVRTLFSAAFNASITFQFFLRKS